MKRIVLAAATAAFALAAGVATAQDKPVDPAEEQIKYRKSVMRVIGGHMGGIGGVMKGATDPSNLQYHADGLAAATKHVNSLFPEGSDFGETTVLPVIWEKPDEFAAAIKALQDAAAAMQAAAASGDMAQVGPAMGNLGKACKDCHENFREKKQ